MKPKHILTKQFVLLITFLGLTLSAAFAQNDFKLTDYKNPFYNYQALDLEFGLYGNNSINNSSGQNGIFDKNNNNAFTGNFTSRYFSMRNAEFFQQEQSYWINFDGGTQKHTFEFKTPSVRETSQKNSGLNLNIGGNSINRFYDSKKRFFELAVTFDGGLANQQSKNEEKGSVNPFKNEIDDNSSLLKASVPLLVGIGRIEEVQDARLAVYILDDLQNSGDLAKTPDKEDVLAFSRFITEIKNKRYFDSRLRKISEITAVDSFLTAQGLKGQSDASYYTLLADNWDYAAGPLRATGKRFSIGIVPNFTLEMNDSDRSFYTYDSLTNQYIEASNNKQEKSENAWGLDFVSNFVCQRPINLYWQQSTAANLSYSLYQSNLNWKFYDFDTLYQEDKLDRSSPNIGLSVSHRVSYYPNSRTTMSLGASAGFDQFWNESERNDDPKQNSNESRFRANLNFACYYYFSPQLRFTVNVYENYQYSKTLQKGNAGNEDSYFKQNNFTSVLQAKLTYSIF